MKDRFRIHTTQSCESTVHMIVTASLNNSDQLAIVVVVRYYERYSNASIKIMLFIGSELAGIVANLTAANSIAILPRILKRNGC